jgi:hypothetical protein
MGKIVLEEHVILDRQEHLDRWRTLVPFIPEQTRQQLIARLTDTSARGPRLVRRDRRDHRDEAPPSPPRSPRSSHSSPRRRPATSPARPSPPTAAAPPSEPAFSQRGDLGLHRLPRLTDMTAQRHRSSRRREHGQPAAGPQDKLNAQATNRERQVGPWTFPVRRSSRCSAEQDWQMSLPQLGRHSLTRWIPRPWISSAADTDCRGSP